MIAIMDILQVIEGKLKEIWPEDEVYQNHQPADFVRPSFCIKMDKSQIAVLHTEGLEITLGIVIDGFVAIDDQQMDVGTALMTRMARVLNLFYDGYITVGNRNPHVVKLESQCQADSFTVHVQLNWGEERTVEDALPLMGELKLNMQEG